MTKEKKEDKEEVKDIFFGEEKESFKFNENKKDDWFSQKGSVNMPHKSSSDWFDDSGKKQVTLSFSFGSLKKIGIALGILVLVALVIYNPLRGQFFWEKGGGSIAEDDDEIAKLLAELEGEGVEKEQDLNVIEEEKTEETPNEEPEETETPEEEAPAEETPSLGSDISLTINDFETSIHNEGEANEYGKIDTVTFTIKNPDRVFVPKILVFAYDKKSPEEFYATPRGKSVSYAALEKGEILKDTITISGAIFNDVEVKPEKVLKLRLYEEDFDSKSADTQLAEAIISVNTWS